MTLIDKNTATGTKKNIILLCILLALLVSADLLIMTKCTSTSLSEHPSDTPVVDAQENEQDTAFNDHFGTSNWVSNSGTTLSFSSDEIVKTLPNQTTETLTYEILEFNDNNSNNIYGTWLINGEEFNYAIENYDTWVLISDGIAKSTPFIESDN